MTAGEQIPLSNWPSGNATVGAWTLDKVTVDYTCPGAYAGATPKPENGHFVKLDIRATTDPVGASNADPASGVNGSDFQFIGPDGITFNGQVGTEDAMESCLPQTQTFPSQLGRGQQFVGSFVVDVPSPKGMLVYYPNRFSQQPPGYEIPIG